MVNYVRACFCLVNTLNAEDLKKLLQAADEAECRAIGEPTVNNDLWFEQQLSIETPTGVWKANFMQIANQSQSNSTFSLNIDANFFFHKGEINYAPHNDARFVWFKSFLISILKQISPLVGMIDFEADPICATWESDYSEEIVSWGNYFPSSWIDKLSDQDKKEIMLICDEFTPISSKGYITFIHPLAYNQAWTKRHEMLEKIIRKTLIN